MNRHKSIIGLDEASCLRISKCKGADFIENVRNWHCLELGALMREYQMMRVQCNIPVSGYSNHDVIRQRGRGKYRYYLLHGSLSLSMPYI